MPPPMTSSFGDLAQFQRAGAESTMRGIVRDERKFHRFRACGDDGVVEAHGLGAASRPTLRR